ncbi:bifunctional nuclease family protein [Bergeyella sp. RCAD1439]|uniref:bifunctional nuclease family protein n=1 Tax=Bergeyella anatis TaxID=3113737 RepID=UPI002E16C904|nr:bifunctional nuclease family protein [Bergeyella sp. RCAD1439]
MEYKQLIIRGISYSQTQSGAYALLLEHVETSVKLPVVIGNFEAQSISLGLEKDLQSPRPLTHDLFTKFIHSVGFDIISVVIYQIVDGVFFSNINLQNQATGEELVLDARTSDAVAMAVRFDAPIFTTDQVLNEAGIVLELEETLSEEEREEAAMPVSDLDNSLRNYSLEDLNLLLDNAVKEEDFDRAFEIQEEIKRRKKKID